MATSGTITTGRRERRRRPLVALAAAALVAALVAPLPAGAENDFTDVDGTTHAEAIGALADLGVLDRTGCGHDMFCPDEPIRRWVMAVWLVRVLGGDMTSDGTSRFADVDASEWWSPLAEQLAIREITAGCKTGPLRYCPNDPVTRGQMATFLVKAFDLPEAAAAGFVDTAGGRHAGSIDALAAAGITAGCSKPLSYCPDDPVTRGQMATFLHRALLKQREETTTADPVEISDDVPDVELTDISTDGTVNLRSLIPGDRAVLLWFWADW